MMTYLPSLNALKTTFNLKVSGLVMQRSYYWVGINSFLQVFAAMKEAVDGGLDIPHSEVPWL